MKDPGQCRLMSWVSKFQVHMQMMSLCTTNQPNIKLRVMSSCPRQFQNTVVS